MFPILKEGNKIKRIAFNLFKKGYSILEVTKKIQNEYKLNGIFDYSSIRFFCSDADSLWKSCGERNQKKLIFGSLNNWKKFNAGIFSKDEFKIIKDTQPLLFVGAKDHNKCNRKFALDIENKTIIYKQDRKNHHKLVLKTTNSRIKLLEKLQIASENNLTPITYKIDKDHVYIMFDEGILKEKDHEFIKNRIGALDLNPNYIAFTIQDFSDNNSKIIHKSIFDLSKLNETHNKNKKDYEVVQISKKISELSKHFKCEIVGLEKLSMVSKNHGKGKILNRLINNSWNRNKFSNNLKKRLNILGIKNQEVVANYSSTVGCLEHPNETDSVAASLEIGRRTYIFLNRFINKEKEFLDRDILFPDMDRKKIKERWNSILSSYNPKNIGYKGIHEYLKNQKKLNLLRFLFKDYDFSSWSCLRYKSENSCVIHLFTHL